MTFALAVPILLAATSASGVAGVSEQSANRPSAEAGCDTTVDGANCDSIISRHAGAATRSVRTTEIDCDEIRFRFEHEEIYTDQELERIGIVVTSLRPGRITAVGPADIGRVRRRFEGATMASIDLAGCDVGVGTAILRVTYSRMDWPQMRAALFTIRSDGSVDEGRDTLFP